MFLGHFHATKILHGIDDHDGLFSSPGLDGVAFKLDSPVAIINAETFGDDISQTFTPSNEIILVNVPIPEGEDRNDCNQLSFAA